MDKNYITNGIFGGINPTLKIHGAASPVVATTNNYLVKIDGAVSSLSAGDLTAIPSTITVPLVSTSVVGVYINAAGTASYVQGTTVLNSSIAANTIYPATINFPQEVPGKALLGWLIIKCASSATFTGGSTNLDAANVTVTYIDKFGVVGL